MILEIRTYRLKPDTGAEFVRVMRTKAAPLLEKHGITVVDCGESLVEENGHVEAYLIRAFASVRAHREQEDAFYGNDEWTSGPREAVVSKIESYHNIVIEVSAETVRELIRSRQPGNPTAE